jgi:hypothetical protein
VGFLLASDRVNRTFVIITRLFLPALAGVLLLESAARQSAQSSSIAGSLALLLGGTYLLQLGLFKLRGISTGYDTD